MPVTAVLFLTLWIAFARASSPQVTITQCGSDGGSCEQSSTSVAPKQPKSSSSNSSTSSGTEVHTYSLRTGKGQVQTPDGGKQSDSIKVELSPSVRDALDPHHHRHVAPAPPVRPPVSTTGGSGVPAGAPGGAPLSSPFSAISSDQALAQFAIPPFLMPVYVAAGRAYGVPWNVLASINQIETDFGRNLSVSSAGAQGWMQFMPATWKSWGVDATGDGYADPYNPADAIFAAARYLRASGGGSGDLSKAILAYNHADWYVAEVLKTAGAYGSLPDGLVNATSTLAYGRFPLLGKASYGDDFRAAQLAGRRPQGLSIHSAGGATAVATQDVTVARILLDPPLAADLKRRGTLGSLGGAPPLALQSGTDLAGLAAWVAQVAAVVTGHPEAPAAPAKAAASHSPSGGLPPGYAVTKTPGITVLVRDAAGDRYGYGGLALLRDAVRPGTKLRSGQAIGSLPPGSSAGLLFSVAAAGGAPVDPRPLVDGYRLQEATDFYSAVQPLGGSPFVPAKEASLAGGHYVFPLPNGVHWTPGRVDMGWDIETGTAGVGKTLLAIGDARILHIQSMGAFGPTWISYRLLDGPAAGRTIFIGHAGPPLVQAGDTVRAGQPIIRVHGGSYGGPPGHFEIGWANADGSNTLAAPHYSEGNVTREGASFQSFVSQLPGTLGGAAFPDGLGTLKPERVSAAQELKLSRELDKISNPHVAQKPSAAAIRVPRRSPSAPAPTSAMSVEPSAAGARVLSVAVPPSGHADEAWAIGMVDGTTRPGWARSQTVLLDYRSGSWQLAGPPRDAQGHVVNPTLRSLAVGSGGAGYAVGDHGSIVAFGRGAPTLLAAATKSDLVAVAVGRTRGFAAGERGAVVRIAGTRTSAERPVAGRPTLHAVTLSPDGSALIAGSPSPDGQPLYRDSGDGTEPVKSDFHLPHGTGVELGSVASSAGQLWVAGTVADSSGSAGPRPFVARRDGDGWRTFCSTGGTPRGVVELGRPTPSVCDATLSSDFTGTLAVTRQGALLATPSGVELFDGKNFRPLRRSLPQSSPSSAAISLAVDDNGCGWAVTGNREIGRVAPAGACTETAAAGRKAPVVRVSPPGASTPATVAVAPDGDRVLAIAGQRAALVTGTDARGLRGPGVPVRAAALTGPSQGWAIADSGQLLSERNGTWSAPGEQSPELRALLDARQALGSAPLIAAGADHGAAGFASLAFRAPDDGYAVGAGSLIAHFDGHAWNREQSPTDADLRQVAAGPGGVIAVGPKGTLIERDGDSWRTSQEAGTLVGGQDFTAAAALADGTLLAVAGGSVIERPSDGSWRAAPIAPLGASVSKLTGYRARDGQVHVLALVPVAGGGLSLLDGDATRWQPVATPAGFALNDFAIESARRSVWIAGRDAQGAATAEVALPGDMGAVDASSPLDALVRSLGL